MLGDGNYGTLKCPATWNSVTSCISHAGLPLLPRQSRSVPEPRTVRRSRPPGSPSTTSFASNIRAVINGHLTANVGDPHVAWPSAARASGFTLSPDGSTVVFIAGQAGGPGGGGRGRGGRGANATPPAAQAPASGADLIAHVLATDKDQPVAHV